MTTLDSEENTAASIARLLALSPDADHLKALLDEVYCAERYKIKQTGKMQRGVMSVTELIKKVNQVTHV
jgi:hypothetical protein